MSNRLKLTNEDLKEAFNFKKHLNLPEKQVYCHIYGRTYETKDGTWLFKNKEELIESFMTSDIFKPLWDEITKVTMHKYGSDFIRTKNVLIKNFNQYLYECNSQGLEPLKYSSKETQLQKYFLSNDTYVKLHNKLEDCINYYKEVAINRMIRKRIIIFHYSS